MATAATAEIAPRYYGVLRIFAFALPLFLSSWSLFAYHPPHDHPHHGCHFACDFCSKRSPTHSHHLFFFGTISYSTLTTCYKVSLLINSYFPFFLFPRTLATLCFFLVVLPFRLTLRCHLDPSSTLTLPEPFPFLRFGTLSIDEFSWWRSFGRSNTYMETKFKILWKHR